MLRAPVDDKNRVGALRGEKRKLNHTTKSSGGRKKVFTAGYGGEGESIRAAF